MWDVLQLWLEGDRWSQNAVTRGVRGWNNPELGGGGQGKERMEVKRRKSQYCKNVKAREKDTHLNSLPKAAGQWHDNTQILDTSTRLQRLSISAPQQFQQLSSLPVVCISVVSPSFNAQSTFTPSHSTAPLINIFKASKPCPLQGVDCLGVSQGAQPEVGPHGEVIMYSLHAHAPTCRCTTQKNVHTPTHTQ